MGNFKKCKKCGEIKNLKEFFKDKYRKGGLHCYCKKCKSELDRYYREKNCEILKQKSKEKYKKNHIEITKNMKNRYANDREYNERIKGNNRKSYLKNREKRIKRSVNYKKNNREKYNINHKNRIKKDIHYKLRIRISSMMNKKLKRHLISKNGMSTFDFLPYTVDELKQHLEKQFKTGMSWENHGTYGWHIDHIIPDCKFNYKSVEDEEFQKCWALENLQPLWAEENLRKNKINYKQNI